jgi:NAD(P)-dependent dehydrogenase (short-subunit alcohol dehydrogenase family)
VHHRSRAPEADELVAEFNACSRRLRAGTCCRPARSSACRAGRGGAGALRPPRRAGQQRIELHADAGRLDHAAQFDDLIGTNLRAPLFLSQAAAPELRQTRGLILNLADIHGMRPLKAHPVYSAAKAGLIMLTKSLARELGPEVRVNGIAPGPVLWPEGGIDARSRPRSSPRPR